MARKVVRDITNLEDKIISLRQEEEPTFVDADAINCSVKQKYSSLNSINHKKSLKDIIQKENQEDNKEEKVFYLHINAEDAIKSIKISEIIRMASAGLVILLFLNIINIYNKGLTLKNDVVATAYSGYKDLIYAGTDASQYNFIGAEEKFIKAGNSFDLALNEISFLNNNKEYFSTNKNTVDSIKGLLDTAKNISTAGQNFSRGIENLRFLPELFIIKNTQNIETQSSDSNQESLTKKLKQDLEYVDIAVEQIKTAKENISKVKAEVLPLEFRNKLENIQDATSKIYDLLTETKEKIPAILELLGDRYPHRYLILLQNDSEARPTGGFIGSYLIVDLNDGYITKFDFNDVYELDGQFQEYIEPPKDIAMVANNWRLRDSNYSPDFTISAEKSAWFLQKEGGPSVDSVITINLSFIEEMLDLTGPIQISELKQPLNKDNFQLILSYIIEAKMTGEESPKEIMKQIIPAFQENIGKNVDLTELISVIIKGFEEKKILFYSRHENVQKLLDELNLSNRVSVLNPNEDYLQVVATSIGGNKSDKYIEQKIRHYTLVNNDGLLTNEVVISRAHTWNGKELKEWEKTLESFGFKDLPDYIIDILGRGKNISFMKIYVPKGSKLKDSYGIDKENIFVFDDEEIDKTYFMFTMDVSPMENKKISITYEPNVKMEMFPVDTYRFKAQSQPSYNPTFLEKKIYFKPGYKGYKTYPDAVKTLEDGSLSYGASFKTDIYLSALIGY